jgi:hypothetical protein
MIDTVEKIYDLLDNQFSCYKITYVNSNKVKCVPLDEANTDYQAIMEFIANGGTVIDNPPEETP